MIYYLCPDYSTPVGGVKIIYRDVDILNANGFEASVLHKHKGFRCGWFDNETKISYSGKVKIFSENYLVIPEVYGMLYAHPESRPKAGRIFKKLFDTPAKKIIYNQNSYNTFNGCDFNLNERTSIYRDKSVVAAIVVSDDNKEYLNYAFPELKIYRKHNSINSQVFSFSAQKKRQICFMPRKNRDHALQVLNSLKFKGSLDAYNIVVIEGKTERQTADIMKESLIFLSFGYPEGFSLPPAEAMSCGCIVIGYHGMGGREYFNSDFCFPIETGDIISFAKTVEHVLELHKNNPALLESMVKKASTYIKENYSKERERLDVLNCWKEIIGNRL